MIVGALLATIDGQQLDVAEHAAQAPLTIALEPRRATQLGADGLIEQQRVGDAVARVGVDDQPLLVGDDDLLRRRLEIEHAVVVIARRSDDGQLDAAGRARRSPGSGSPNCSTSACSVWSTMKNAAVERRSARRRRRRRRRRGCACSSLRSPLRRRRRRRRAAAGGAGAGGRRRLQQSRQRQIGQHARSSRPLCR